MASVMKAEDCGIIWLLWRIPIKNGWNHESWIMQCTMYIHVHMSHARKVGNNVNNLMVRRWVVHRFFLLPWVQRQLFECFGRVRNRGKVSHFWAIHMSTSTYVLVLYRYIPVRTIHRIRVCLMRTKNNDKHQVGWHMITGYSIGGGKKLVYDRIKRCRF